jgi:hypothetical protein
MIWTASIRGLCLLLTVGLVLLGPGAQTARAGLVSTAAAMEAHRGGADPDRERVHAFLDREDVQAQFRDLGISSDEAHRRVAALSDSEIAAINGRLDQLPAGGSFVGVMVGIILVLFLVLVITDLLGFTDVFPFINPLPRGQQRSR